jgi:hypothetical protein
MSESNTKSRMDILREGLLEDPHLKMLSALFTEKLMRSFSSKLKADPQLMDKVADHFMAAIREVIPPELLDGQEEDTLRKTVVQGIHNSLDDYASYAVKPKG